jgi:hypothetical protein
MMFIVVALMVLTAASAVSAVTPQHGSTLSPRRFTSAELALTIPEEFDSAVRWPQCPTITMITDQGDCGSGWAVSAAGVMSDRYCIAGGPQNLSVSAVDLLSCCADCRHFAGKDGCSSGGRPTSVWNFWVDTGISSSDCNPYPFPKCHHWRHGPGEQGLLHPIPACSSSAAGIVPKCQNATCSKNATQTATPRLWRGSSAYTLNGTDAFQRDIMINGPIQVVFDEYNPTFERYRGGVYTHGNSTKGGGHCMRIVGWGSLEGIDYWKVANSWNREWGMDGYILVKRGVNECGIESRGMAGLPMF